MSYSKQKQTNSELFPGEPKWEDYLAEQRHAKKRQIGLPRRIARVAIDGFANAVLVGKAASVMPAALAEAHHKDRAKRLQPARNQHQEIAARHALQKAERAGSRVENRARKLGRLASWALGHREEIKQKRQATYERRQRQFETKRQDAWKEYLEQNPEVEKRLVAEQKQRDRQYEINSQAKRHGEMQEHASSATKHFVERNSYSFSKALPRRPGFEGSYDTFAKSTLEHAAKARQDNGSITLLGSDTLMSVVQDKMPLSPEGAKRDGPVIFDGETRQTNENFHTNDRLMFADIRAHTDYVGGVATSLWKMGFVEFESEDSISRSNGQRMSEAIEWSQGEDGTTFASLPYDPENELHRIVAGDRADSPDARIQLAIGNQQYAPEMSVSLVPQPALVHA